MITKYFMVSTPSELPQIKKDKEIALTQTPQRVQEDARKQFMHIKMNNGKAILILCARCETQYDPRVIKIAAQQGITGKQVEKLIENASHTICDPAKMVVKP
jgi:hypothetical protein